MSEVRLIDANALKDAHIECPNNISFFDFGEMVERFLQTVDEQPTVDAVPVRCKECKYIRVSEEGLFKSGYFCERCHIDSDMENVDDWFCADGERR
jgi:hypothetical protein